LAKQLPFLLITPESHRLLDSGPVWRRKYLDWGVFHVEHSYASNWAKYNLAIKQRNALLANRAPTENIGTWSQTVEEYGVLVHESRKRYFDRLEPLLIKYCEYFFPGHEIQFHYFCGWAKEKTLKEALQAHYDLDVQQGRTLYGPHRADIRISFNGMSAREAVSRGQQKLLVYAMRLAQTTCLYELMGKKSTLLLDDLGAELDKTKTEILMDVIDKEFNQIVVTTADKASIPLDNFSNRKLFHVEQGLITSQ
jgi:DNA replication and repair protein RecF